MTNASNPISVFYSYSHKDEDLRAELEAHLAALWRSGLISEWHDRKIVPGENWKDQIDQHLDSAQLILFLVSADFINSGYCMDVEVTRALERQKRGECVVVPVILRPVVWQVIPWLHELQALPKDALPIIQWSPRDLAYVNVCEGILRVLQSRTPPPPTHRPSASRARKRFFDAAIPAKVPVHKPSALLVMVRRSDSPGLTGVVESDAEYGMSGKDVHSKPATLHFPMQDGVPQPLDLVVKVESPEFEPKSQTKTIHVPPKGDSQPHVFFLTPQDTGSLVLNVELCLGSEQLSFCMLRTEGVATESRLDPPKQSSATAAAEELEEPADAGASDLNRKYSARPPAPSAFEEAAKCAEAPSDLQPSRSAAPEAESPSLPAQSAPPAPLPPSPRMKEWLNDRVAGSTPPPMPQAPPPSKASAGWMKYGITACLVAIVGVFGSYLYNQQNSSSPRISGGGPSNTTSSSEAPLPEGLSPNLATTYRAALRGDPAATYAIAFAYYSGEGAKQDYAAAAQWCHKAADAGNTDAMVALGNLYLQGAGVNRSQDEAIRWLGKAAELGNPRAQQELQKLREPSEKEPPKE